MFTPDHGKQSTCPAPLDRFDNYRRTVIHREQQEPLALEDQYKTLTKEQRNREPTGGLWQGETWFRILPEQKEGTTRIQQEQSQNKQSTSTPVLMRHTGKQSEKETAIPSPEKVRRTTDYWIGGRHWKRVHVIPRTEFYAPTPEDSGPDINKLLPTRYTNIHSEHNMRRIEDNWTTEPQPTRKEQRTGSTTFEESIGYSEDLLTEDDTPQMATRAKAMTMTMPTQPTPQEIEEHNITHMPYRSWCPICVQAKGRQANHPKQTSRQQIVKVDFTYITSFGVKFATPILKAIDMQTGMAMAAMIIDKHNQFSYAKTCLQAFLLECGRSEGILQSDSEEYLIALVRATAKACGNMAVRFSPAYSSQSNGNVERYHRTLTGQIRTLRELVQQNYNIQIPTDHPLMAWAVRHSAYLINRFLIMVHKLSSTMWTYTQCSPMWIWRNCNVHGPYTQTTTKARAKVLQRYLV